MAWHSSKVQEILNQIELLQENNDIHVNDRSIIDCFNKAIENCASEFEKIHLTLGYFIFLFGQELFEQAIQDVDKLLYCKETLTEQYEYYINNRHKMGNKARPTLLSSLSTFHRINAVVNYKMGKKEEALRDLDEAERFLKEYKKLSDKIFTFYDNMIRTRREEYKK